MGVASRIPQLGYQYIGPLTPNQALLLHSDGVNVPAERMGQIIAKSRNAQEAVRQIVNEAETTYRTQDNAATRLITDRPEKIEAFAAGRVTNNGRMAVPPTPEREIKPPVRLASSVSKPRAAPSPPARVESQRPPGRGDPLDERPWGPNGLSIKEMKKGGYFDDLGDLATTIYQNELWITPPNQKAVKVPTGLAVHAYEYWRSKYKPDGDTRVRIPTPWGNAHVNGNQLEILLRQRGIIKN